MRALPAKPKSRGLLCFLLLLRVFLAAAAAAGRRVRVLPGDDGGLHSAVGGTERRRAHRFHEAPLRRIDVVFAVEAR